MIHFEKKGAIALLNFHNSQQLQSDRMNRQILFTQNLITRNAGLNNTLALFYESGERIIEATSSRGYTRKVRLR
jgi:hypothetical protein